MLKICFPRGQREVTKKFSVHDCFPSQSWPNRVTRTSRNTTDVSVSHPVIAIVKPVTNSFFQSTSIVDRGDMHEQPHEGSIWILEASWITDPGIDSISRSRCAYV